MPGPLYLTQSNDPRTSPPKTSKLPNRGPIELLVIHEFSRQNQHHRKPSDTKSLRELPDVRRDRLGSIDSVLSTVSSVSSIGTSNTAAISPVTVLAEIHYDPTKDSEARADESIMWRCRKHKTRSKHEIQENSLPISNISLGKDCECTCYDWTGGRGREVADGL